MSLFVVATYAVLGGIIVYLLVLLSSKGRESNVEVRDTMLAPEELHRHAIEMARNHPVGRSARSLHWLVSRLNDNYGHISAVHDALNRDVAEAFPTAPAAEWLLDNFYIIEEQVRLIRRNLTKGQYSRLPALKKGYLKGYPRVYAIALELVAHSDGNIDEKTLTGFVQAYQSQMMLSMGELWAVPLMLRIALVESIRNICDKIWDTRQEWHRAESLVSAIAANGSEEKRIEALLEEQLDRMDSISPSFVEHLLQKLRKLGKGLSVVTVLLDRRLIEENASAEAFTALEHQLQATMQVSIGNSITGLRLISDMDWTDIFESLSKVEQILRQDPCGIYAVMDFDSRDYYRHEVEKLARSFGTSELNVAQKAVDCAIAGKGNSPQDHVGYYIAGKGRKALLHLLGSSGTSRWKPFRRPAGRPLLIYLGSIAVTTVILLSLFVCYAAGRDGSMPVLRLVLTALLVFIPCSELAVCFSNTLLSHIFRPTMLPKLELKEGIPPELASVVIIPTLLPGPSRVRELLLQLEVYYLANRERNLYFALVGDFKDAPSAEQENDEIILKTALEGIRELNGRYSDGSCDIFYFMNRKRLYNKSQNRWMGWERKRGAITEFNRLLRGDGDTGFNTVSGEVSRLREVKYVITLDADTNLPMGAAKRLIGTIAHPLNRAVVSEETGLVAEGHGLLQPRISVGVQGANRSLFTRIFAGQGGVDPYTTAVSDIYQDIFDEGIFTGKGIYEIDVFQRVLDGRIPDNTVLSHDLIEGCHLRAGLVSDIELVDGYPARYNSYAARQHRWTRGDWQLLPWLAGNVRDKSGARIKNRLSGISKWKIADNLRRSLLYPALLFLFLAGPALLPVSPLMWTGLVLLTTASPLLTGLLDSILSDNLQFGRRNRNAGLITGVKAACYQSVLLFLFLPHQAYLLLDAIIRTIGRVCITHRNMLEWVTAADVEAGLKDNPASFFRKMWFSVPAALATPVLAAYGPAEGLYVAVPAAFLWLASPFAAYWVSRPNLRKKTLLPENDLDLLRLAARKTWRFFEDFAAEGDNDLPPDNFQLDPPKGVAHRTSPTNIGLLFVSVLSAGDLGYIGAGEMGDRFDRILSTLERMEKWEGHLYNWYNTVTLETLRPLYVSTVDSGNLVGYMMVAETGLREHLRGPVPSAAMALGMRDTLILACREMGEEPERSLMQLLSDIGSVKKLELRQWAFALRKLDEWMKSRLPEQKEKPGWAGKLADMVDRCLRELQLFYPLVALPEAAGFLGKINPALAEELFSPASLLELPERCRSMAQRVSQLLESGRVDDPGSGAQAMAEGQPGKTAEKQTEEPAMRAVLEKLAVLLEQAGEQAEAVRRKYAGAIDRLGRLIRETDFSPLFDPKRLLFSIGFNVEDGHLGKSYYDLLASEARQASYIAIARGEVDRRHWARLGRKLASYDGGKGLVSWTGTMFEYLMPYLIMKNYESTLFDETYSFVIKAQKKYGKTRGIPWGISESGYSAFDMNLNYQYKAFGVPELGLKRGLANDMVVSPYSTLLALCIEPQDAVENLKELSRLGMDGDWGYYEAIDFTPSRLDRDVQYHIVKSYMAHHQGMSLAALNNFFNAGILQERFHSDPVIQAAELLLQEKSPDRAVYKKECRNEGAVNLRKSDTGNGETIRIFGVPAALPPNAHLLSNGTYSVLVTDGGSGFSKEGDMAVTRWSGDYYRSSGFYIFLQNINSNTVWSATYEPLDKKPERYRVVFSPDKAEFSRRDGNLETYMEMTVSPEDNAEVRRVSVTNHSKHERIVELTSYFEVVLAPLGEDAAHPAFSKLFVRTEFVREYNCLLASRRHRKENKSPLWLLHTMAVEGGTAVNEPQYETDRMKFIGRNREITDPAALDPDQPLGNSEGSILDPVMSLRRRVRIEPGHTVRVAFTAAVAQSKKQALELAEKYNDFKTSERVFELSWTRSQVEARYLGLDAQDAEFYLDLVSLMLYHNPLKREYERYIQENTGAQPDLWPFGISGDLPLVLVEINDEDDIELAQWAVKGHEFWRMKGLVTDLVLLVNRKEGYAQPLHDQVQNIVAASHARELVDRYGGVFIRNASVLEPMQITLLYTTARLVIKDSVEALKTSIREMRKFSDAVKSVEAIRPAANCVPGEGTQDITVHHPAAERKLAFFNGIGGFSADGREYVIQLGGGRYTPLPWSNIIANKSFGFLVTESGGGYTWAENGREFKLTPWYNDPVTDRQGELFYIRDMVDCSYWSLTPKPAGDSEPYTVRHGHGYTVFEHTSSGLAQTLTLFVSPERQIKLCIVTLSNITGRARKLAVTYYIRPILGVGDETTSSYIVTRPEGKGVLLVKNQYSHEFRDKVIFLGTNAAEYSLTGDRTGFFGPGGTAAAPRALMGDELAGVTGAGLDPCAAISARVGIEPEEEISLVFMLGCADSPAEALELAGRFAGPGAAEAELEKVGQFWKEKLDAIRITTPDDSFNTIMNGWLPYQTIVCRLWARSAYYQAGGAFGFRDQLQDCMAVMNSWPELAREQILLHASRQYREGDVQHWWHAERGKGIRTRYSDDLLWLAYVTAEYLEKTGDWAVLDEQANFLEGAPLEEGEDEKYEEPVISGQTASLYDHCVLAIDRSLETGRHGLPLMGSGDWNDGMNTVGNKGLGESVWLAWFLLSVLKKFIPICSRRQDAARAERYGDAASRLIESIEGEAWDGSWYRRAYFDDGTPLGSIQNPECRIDSIAQSWSVLSGAAKPQRMLEAMGAVQKYLVDANEGIVKLLTPPFDDGALHPGYIKGYVPGVRENGGQYTHAAVWTVLAFARLGMGDKACELFHMINPINHTRTPIEYSRYKCEPYVIAADVYAVHPHVGRGGWSWYTGAAGWLYKVGLEGIAGLRRVEDRLFIDPCIPHNWERFEIIYRLDQSCWNIEVRNPDKVCSGVIHVLVDGKSCPEGSIRLPDYSGYHRVEVILGKNGEEKPAAPDHSDG
jgi:cellobiose phosphorylase